jgi:methyltransferase (TIGR00027 family)
LRDRVRILEVDHPATQSWKHHCLEEADIVVPGSLTYAPIDFERQTLADGLAAAGFHPATQTFFLWLGVVPYLTEQVVWSTLGFAASLPHGAHVVFDYGEPAASLPPEKRAEHQRRAQRVAELGESWLTFFAPEDLHAGLIRLGFSELEDLGPPQIVSRYFPNHAGSVPRHSGHIIHARTS